MNYASMNSNMAGIDISTLKYVQTRLELLPSNDDEPEYGANEPQDRGTRLLIKYNEIQNALSASQNDLLHKFKPEDIDDRGVPELSAFYSGKFKDDYQRIQDWKKQLSPVKEALIELDKMNAPFDVDIEQEIQSTLSKIHRLNTELENLRNPTKSEKYKARIETLNAQIKALETEKNQNESILQGMNGIFAKFGL